MSGRRAPNPGGYACTITAASRVPFARVLARSFKEHHPDGRFVVLVLDDLDRHIDAAEEPYELLVPDEIDCPEFDLLAARYDEQELAAVVTPWLLRHALAQGAAAVTYLDPCVRLFDSLASLQQLAVERGAALIARCTVAIPDDGQRPTYNEAMARGPFEPGCVTLASGDQAEQLLESW